MRVVLTSVLLLFGLCTIAQKKGTFDSYLTFQFTKTIKDATKGNNPWGIGLGLQTYYNVSKVFRPVLEITGDAYLMDDKVLRLYSDGEAMRSVRGIVNIFAGPGFQLGPNVNFSLAAGPSFVSDQVLPGVKPSLNFFPRSQRAIFKLALIRVYDRGSRTRKNFDSYSVGAGFRIF